VATDPTAVVDLGMGVVGMVDPVVVAVAIGEGDVEAVPGMNRVALQTAGMDEVRVVLGSLLPVPTRIEDEVVHVEVVASPLTLVVMVHTMAMEVEVVVDTTMGIIVEVEDTATMVKKMAGVEEAGVEVVVHTAVPEDFLRHGPDRPPRHKICSTSCLYRQMLASSPGRRRCWLLVCRHGTLPHSDIVNMHGYPFPHYCLPANRPSLVPPYLTCIFTLFIIVHIFMH